MRVLTAEQTRQVDQRTIREFGVPGLLLMENAGMRVVEALEARTEDLDEASVVILCGKGNNGGDGLVVARQLIQRDCYPWVFLFAPEDEVTGDARVNLEILTRAGHAPTVIGELSEWRRKIHELGRVDIVVDALLGTGLRGPVQGLLAGVIASVEDEWPDSLIVSVDLPSGCLADTGEVPGPAVAADLTVSFSAAKPCLVFPPACHMAGDVVIAGIGNPSQLVDSDDHRVELLTPDSFTDLDVGRDPDTHKGDYGRVLVIGGSTGKAGAAAMSGEAALRSGAGLVTVATPASALPSVAARMPELMTCPLPETREGMISAAALDDTALGDLLETASVVVVGPGLGRHPDTGEFVRGLVASLKCPAVIDADGLFAFRADSNGLKGREHPIVLTPHPGEMAGLLGQSIEHVAGNRLEVVRGFARDQGVYAVLKGYRTLIAGPDGRVCVNPTGNAAMATAGSGDVLAGMVGALLGQPHLGGFSERLCLAVYLHGLAGDQGVEDLGEEGLTATDLIAYLPDAWAELRGQ